MLFRLLLVSILLPLLVGRNAVVGAPAFGGAARPARIGYCAALKEIDAARAAGFDYLELRTSELAALSDHDYEEIRDKLRRLVIQVPVTYLFLPGSLKVTGPSVDEAQQMRYVRKALDRAAGLGVRVVTFGSGPARQVPEGFSKEEAFRQLVEFCRRVGPEARARNITIAIEPQRRQECNIINTAGEGLELVRAVDDPNIQLMVDFYHLSVEKEDPAIILKAGDHIRHIHMANPEGRVFPLRWEEYTYAPFFENLRRSGYAGGISLEASATDFSKDAPRSIAFLRGVLARYQPR